MGGEQCQNIIKSVGYIYNNPFHRRSWDPGPEPEPRAPGGATPCATRELTGRCGAARLHGITASIESGANHRTRNPIGALYWISSVSMFRIVRVDMSLL